MLEHENHEVSHEIQQHYPQVRRLNSAELQEANKLCGLKIKNIRLRDYLRTKTGKLITLKDVENIKRQNSVDGTVDSLVNELGVIMEADPNCSLALDLAEDGMLQCLWFQLSDMKSTFRLFPEVLFMDATYKITSNNMVLLTLMVMDGNGHGQPVAYSFMSNETKVSFTFALDQLIHHSGLAADSIKTVILDKDSSEIAAVEESLPSADIIICRFHVLKYLKQMLYEKLPKCEQRQEAEKVIKSLVYAKSEEAYKDALAGLYAISGAESFAVYFLKNWDSCKSRWVRYLIEKKVNLDCFTNNHLESHNQKIKGMLNHKMTLATSITELVRLANHKSSESRQANVYASIKTALSHTFPEDDFFTQHLTDFAAQAVRNQLAKSRDKKLKVAASDVTGIVIVSLDADTSYRVNTSDNSCSCQRVNSKLVPCSLFFFNLMVLVEDEWHLNQCSEVGCRKVWSGV